MPRARERRITEDEAGEAEVSSARSASAQIVGGAEAPLRIARCRARYDGAERGGRRRVDDAEIRRAVVQQAGNHLVRRPAAEETPARQHLVEHAAEGEDVAAPVHPSAGHLFGRHVAEGTEHDPGRGLGEGGAVVGELGAVEALQRQAEIEDLDRAVRGQEDVLRLEVAVDDAARVRGGEPVGNGCADADHLAPRADAGHDPCAQRLAFEQLHDGDRHAVDDRQLVNRHDARVR